METWCWTYTLSGAGYIQFKFKIVLWLRVFTDSFPMLKVIYGFPAESARTNYRTIDTAVQIFCWIFLSCFIYSTTVAFLVLYVFYSLFFIDLSHV